MKTMERRIAWVLTVIMLLTCSGIQPAFAASSTITISTPKAWSLYSWDDSVTAKWNAVTGASGYYIAMRFITDDDLVLERTYTTNTSFKISSYFLEKAGRYHIWVGAVAAKGDTTYLSQDQHDFYVSHEPDISNGSASGITKSSAQLSMDINLNYGYGISDWGFYVGETSTRSKMTKYSQGSTSSKGTHYATITGLDPNTKYFYRAYAENDVGEDYTAAKSFTTLPGELARPVITYPVSGNTYTAGSSIKLQWNAVSGADGYRYYIKQLSGTPDYQSDSEPSVNSWTGSTSSGTRYYTLSASNVKGGYWYKFVVEAYYGSASSWSEWCYVYVEKGSLAKAVVVSPENTATYTGYQSIKFDWNAVSGAEGYTYYIKRLDGLPDRTNDNEPGTLIENGTTGSGVTEFTLSASKAIPGKWYKFVVEAHADGMNSSWSEWVYCYIDEAHLDRPVISSPSAWSEMAAGSSITVKWGAVSGASGYQLYYKQLSGYPDTSNDNEPAIYSASPDCGNALKYTVSASKVIGGYWYKFVVKAYSASGAASWSPWVYVYVPETGDLDRPVITSPVAAQNYESGKSIRFTWGKVDNATSYTYYVKQLVGEPDHSDNERAVQTWTGTTRATNRLFTLTGENVQPNTWYKFVVKAEADGYNSSWSKYTYIKIPDREDWIYYVLPSAMTCVSQEAFYNNKLLRTFDASESQLLSIESKAFANCTNLKSINLPYSVSEIAEDAFSNCTSLTIHCISGSYAESYAIRKGIPVEVHGIALLSDMLQLSDTEWNIPTKDAAETAIRVNSSAGWSAESSDPTWLSVDKETGSDGTMVVIRAKKNTGTTRSLNGFRSAVVTFTCGTAKAVFTVIQNALASQNCAMKVLPAYWEPSSSQLTREIIVENNAGFSVSSSDPSWLTFTVSNATITAKVTSAALSSAKTGVLTVTCADCGATQEVTVTTKGNYVPVPTGLQVTAVDTEALRVSWDAVNNTSYIVERTTDDASGWTQVKTVAAGAATSFMDSGLKPGTLYYYRVYARKVISGSTVTSEACASKYARTNAQERLSFTGKYGSLSDGGCDTLANLSTVSWQTTSEAVTYKVALRNRNTDTLVSGWNKKDVGNVSSVSLSGSLSEGTGYRIWVGAYNTYGHLIGQTNALEFTVQSTEAPVVSDGIVYTKGTSRGVTVKGIQVYNSTYKTNGTDSYHYFPVEAKDYGIIDFSNSKPPYSLNSSTVSCIETIRTSLYGSGKTGAVTALWGEYYSNATRSDTTWQSDGLHEGIDLQGSPNTTEIYSLTDGIVRQAGTGTYGVIAVEKGNYWVIYMHCSSSSVAVGDQVYKGQKIGKQGNKGSSAYHVHLSVFPKSWNGSIPSDLNNDINETYQGLGQDIYSILSSLISASSEAPAANALTKETMISRLNASSYLGSKKEACVVLAGLLWDSGFPPAYIAGVLANIYAEGTVGLFENISGYTQARLLQVYPGLKKISEGGSGHQNYIAHMKGFSEYDSCGHNHSEYAQYSNKKIYDGFSLKAIDALLASYQAENWNARFGLGTVQWTADRTVNLMTFYHAEAGASADTITYEQCLRAEMKCANSELLGSKYWVFTGWLNANTGAIETSDAAYSAGYRVAQYYESPGQKSEYPKRGNIAKDIYSIMLGE